MSCLNTVHFPRLKVFKKFFLILLIPPILLISCKSEVYQINKNHNERITVEDFDKNLKIDYGVSSLLKHEIYYDGLVVESQFFLEKSVTESEKESLKMFVINKFIYQKIDNYHPGKYDEFLIANRDKRPLAEKYVIVFLLNNKIDQVIKFDNKLNVLEDSDFD